MKITQRDNKKIKSLKDINAGQVFVFSGEMRDVYHMKTANTHGGFIIVVKLDDGFIGDFDPHDKVICVNAELVVE